MAKGEGGGGHFDERRRAKASATGYADSEEVLSALVKPRAKPTVVVKKKKVIAPSRVQTDSDPGEVAEPATRMTVTRYNTERLKPQSFGFVSPDRKPVVKPQSTGFVSPSRKAGRLIVPSTTTAPSADWGRPGMIEAELRSQRTPAAKRGVQGFRPPGGGKSLADWFARLKLDT